MTSKKPTLEVSIEEASKADQLIDIINAKTKEKNKLEEIDSLHLLTKSRFYYNADKQLREHVGTYKGFAILLKQEKIKEILNDKENTMFPSLVTLTDLKRMKRVNGNIVRKINPDSLHEYEIMALIQGIILEIDKGL